MSALETTFWIALALGLYPYVGYPVVAWVLARLLRNDVRRDEACTPAVTVVTAARNEAACIEATIRNKLAQDYPAGRLDMIVVSDESDDGTDAVVARLAAEGLAVRLIRQQPRAGKTVALNVAVPQARGEVVVFADANSMYDPQALRRLVRNFADARVGYVTGRMVYLTHAGSAVGEGLGSYMRLENWLRAQETAIGSVVGVDGGADAVRKSLYRPMNPDQLPDFVLPLDVVQQGYRVVYEPEALLEEEGLASGEQEFRMRVRVALRALWALSDKRTLFNPARYRAGLNNVRLSESTRARAARRRTRIRNSCSPERPSPPRAAPRARRRPGNPAARRRAAGRSPGAGPGPWAIKRLAHTSHPASTPTTEPMSWARGQFSSRMYEPTSPTAEPACVRYTIRPVA